MTLAEVVKEVLRPRRPMRQTDLVVAMIEAGYQTTMKPKGQRDAVGNVLTEGQGGISESGGKWTVVISQAYTELHGRAFASSLILC